MKKTRPSTFFRANEFQADDPHSCTVVGNPGGGPWGFLANSFEGGTWGCEKIRGGSCFISFLCGNFSKIFIGGTWGAPPPPIPPPLCAPMA